MSCRQFRRLRLLAADPARQSSCCLQRRLNSIAVNKEHEEVAHEALPTSNKLSASLESWRGGRGRRCFSLPRDIDGGDF